MTDHAATADEKTWFGHPRGLTVLFLTETWEKFSYYGMRALLVYYMTKQLLLTQEFSSLVYGTYISAAYFTPIIGGVIADRWLGPRRSVVIGGSIMVLGHFMMAFEPLFYPALAAIAIGNGLYLPSLPSQINSLYRPEDPRRTGAYNVYYVGVNLGATAAAFLCGWLGETYGWHYGFGAAGVGMALGVLVYLAGGRYLPKETRRSQVLPQAGARPAAAIPRDELQRRFFFLGLVLMCVVLFRGAYEQLGNTVALWTEAVDRSVSATREIPMTWFQTLNPALVLIMTPMLLARWLYLAKQGREPSTLQKMSMGAWGVGLAYFLIAAAATWTASQGISVHWLWLVAFFIVLTAGELYILPIGLGLFGRLAPAGMAATLIAVWFAAISAGNFLSGVLGTFWSKMGPAEFFSLMGGVCGAAGVLLLLLDHPLRRVEREAGALPGVAPPNQGH